jgi:bifunctional ADP-heptose synthase (sugar kinase/adenylyltransferase)
VARQPCAGLNLSTITDAEFEQKICSREELKQRVAALPKPVVLTNGVFDILHRAM